MDTGTRVVHALFVDDEDTLREQYFENIAIALSDVCGVELTHESVTRVEDAKQKLRRGQSQFQLVVVDMLWHTIGGSSEKLDARGLEVVQQAAKTPGVVIVAISVGDTVGFPRLQEQALEAGAHIFRIRGALQAASRAGGWEALAQEICTHLGRAATQAGHSGIEKDILTSAIGLVAETTSHPDTRALFVVCGRDVALNESLYQFLRALGLSPYEWEDLVTRTTTALGSGGNPSILNVIDHGFTVSHGAVVLFSPDDEARLRERYRKASDPPYEARLQGQPRPNVLFEAGYAIARKAAHTLIVSVGGNRPISDLAGKHIVYLDDSPEKRKTVAERLRAMGFAVRTTGDQWLTVGHFSVETAPPPKVAPPRRRR